MLTLGIIVLASLVASCSDWLFMNVLVHRFYAADTTLWRRRSGSARIVVSQLAGTLATACVVVLCTLVPTRPLLVAALLWAGGPLPIVLQNLQWMPLHPAIGTSHAAGWLTRALIAAELEAHLGAR